MSTKPKNKKKTPSLPHPQKNKDDQQFLFLMWPHNKLVQQTNSANLKKICEIDPGWRNDLTRNDPYPTQIFISGSLSSVQNIVCVVC